MSVRFKVIRGDAHDRTSTDRQALTVCRRQNIYSALEVRTEVQMALQLHAELHALWVEDEPLIE